MSVAAVGTAGRALPIAVAGRSRSMLGTAGGCSEASSAEAHRQAAQKGSSAGGFDQRLRGRDGLAGLGWGGVGRAARPSRPHCLRPAARPNAAATAELAWRGMSRSFVAGMLSLDELLRPSVPRLLPTALCACEPADAASRGSGAVGARAILRCASTACCGCVAIAVGTVLPTGRPVGAKSGCLSACIV